MVTMLLSLGGCAGMPTHTKNLLIMSAAGSIGATVGALSAPQNESKVGHALMWGGVSAATAGAAALIFNNDSKTISDFQNQIEVSRKENAMLRGDVGNGSAELLYEIKNPYGPDGKEFPAEYRHLVKPGQWRVYKLDQWVSQGEGTMIHQDKMISIIPPQLNPRSAVDENAANQTKRKNENENNKSN